MKIDILQKNGKVIGFEFRPTNITDNLELRKIEDRLRNLKVPIKLRSVKEIKDESLIIETRKL